MHHRYDAMASLVLLLFAAFIAIDSPTLASDIYYAHPAPENRHGELIAKDDTPVGFPYFLSSFSGLTIDNDVDKAGEVRKLDLVRRVPDGATVLRNNHVQTREILMGEIQHAHFTLDSNGGNNVNDTSSSLNNNTSKRAITPVYLSLTICSKPILNESIADTALPLPQLAVYVSTSGSLQDPGPHHGNDTDQAVYRSEEGYMSTNVSSESNVYIGVVAPEAGNFSGSYSYQIAASTDGLFHNIDEKTALLHISDSGSDTALLTTVSPADQMLTQDQLKDWRNRTAIYTMFVNNANNTAIAGISRSYCALEQHSQAAEGDNIQTSMTTRDKVDNGLQEQFYVTGLNRSSSYIAVLAMPGNSSNSGNSVGGGGKLWQPKPFSTKTSKLPTCRSHILLNYSADLYSDGNCAVVYGLEFCSDVAYAVPSHPSLNISEIRSKYDNYAEELYTNFNYSLQQIQCNTSNETIFSMAVNCTVCASAYKNWLCAVTIPQCDDFSSTTKDPNFMMRNTGQAFPNGTHISNITLRDDPMRNRSRNPNLIDKQIQPGPYNEYLPHLNTCHELVRSCPMALGFQCPKGELLQYSYQVSSGWELHIPSSLRILTIGSAFASGMLWLF
jgi:hypothetical protein